MKTQHGPPDLFHRFFRWFCNPELRKYIEGDLLELYHERVRISGKRRANFRFILDVLFLFRPGIIKSFSGIQSVNNYTMFKSYFKIGWRNLLKNKGYSFINIGGMAAGMTVAMFIGLWIYDELSFNKYHDNYDSIAQVYSCELDPETTAIRAGESIQYPVRSVLRNNYPQYFKHVLMAWWFGNFTLSTEDKKFNRTGEFIETGAIEMLSLKMLQGTTSSLDNQHSIILSKSTATAIFGSEDPMNKSLKINNKIDVQVTGIYEDIPRNNRFNEVQFFSPFALWELSNPWIQEKDTDWDNRPFNIYVQLQPNTTMEEANAAIKDLYRKNIPPDFYKTVEKYQPFVQLVPMSTWHLYSEFANGKPSGGGITYVWLFAIVGIFVLMLACINFINLSTARSEKRSREVGVRKAVGSAKRQLIFQFLSESFLVVMLAFLLAVLFLALLLDPFNQLADKNIALPFANPMFWTMILAFVVITGFMSGLYPAFYLSSFQPAKVLKGALHAGRFASLPRKVLVVIQFTVSVILIIGTLVVYQQIQYARNRPVGYDREGLIMVSMNDPAYEGKQDVLRTELLNTGVVSEIARSSMPLTAVWNVTSGYDWQGRDPNVEAEFVNAPVSLEFGKTVGWEFVAGRDFSSDIATDTIDAVVVNEAAIKYMGLKDPIGQEFVDVDEYGIPKWSKKIIGVVKDVIMESPYGQVKQAFFYYESDELRLLHIRINPAVSAGTALPKIEAVFKKIVPTAIFDYSFVDEIYARKFSQEQRIGKLSGIFSILAILISCLGLFGLASFVAEQRTKEIGIRKVMGASVANVWQMLSRDFVVLVIVSCFIAVPIGYYFMSNWLEQYQYRTEISWWIILLTCLSALLITLLTVSFQSVKAALANPVNSLRSE